MEPLIFTLPLMQMASGDTLSLQVYEFTGATAGKTAYIQANLHGAELAGNAVIHRLIQHLSAQPPDYLAGTLRLVPVCNPLGVNTRAHNFASGRYNPYDGRDYNRIFWDYEKAAGDIAGFAEAHRNSAAADILQAYRHQIQAAFQREREAIQAAPHLPVHQLYRNQLQSLALDADYVIDLHTSSNRGLTYLYFMEGRSLGARLFNLDFAILLDDYDGDAFDEAFLKPWLALERSLSDLGRTVQFDLEAYTLELGSGMDLEAPAVERGYQGVMRYLSHKGVLEAPIPADVPEMPLSRTSQVTKYYAATGGLIESRVDPGTWVRPGDGLYTLLRFNKSGLLPEAVVQQSDRAGMVFDVATNRAVNQGEYILALMQFD
ncbi:succinylglutamate desuccinylase [filamentous cyanobacterium CCP5]|nr:succinylglutamate desuccinylase [filamentous cyanobacterium CCP5]